MFGEKAGDSRFFTKHPEEFCCRRQQKRTFEKPCYWRNYSGGHKTDEIVSQPA
jgi:hypothetical protein